MITYKEYFENSTTLHEAYFGQFVTPAILLFVGKAIGINVIKQSHDKHFNDIPLHKWDALHPYIMSTCRAKVQTTGAHYSLSVSVCIAKQAARRLKENAFITAA